MWINPVYEVNREESRDKEVEKKMRGQIQLTSYKPWRRTR
jgi:hypothetical protein